MADILNMINHSISSASSWFVSIFNAAGMVEVYIAIIFILFGIRFLVVPIFGRSRGSDRARKQKGEDTVNE